MKNTKKITALLLVCAMQPLSLPAYGVPLEHDDNISFYTDNDVEATASPVEAAEDTGEIPLESLSEFSAPDAAKAERFIVKYKRNEMAATQAELSADLSAAYNIKSVREVDFTAERGIGFFSTESEEEIQVIELNEAADIEDFKADINSEYRVEYVQPDYKLDLSAENINISTETELTDTADDITEGNADYNTELTEDNALLDINEYNFAQTIVAVIDTGIDIEHESLQGHIYCNAEEQGNDEDGNGYEGDINGWDFYNNSPEVYDSELGLDQAHGTHIAGVIAETAPNAQILPLKVFENGIAYTSDIIEAIQYADMMGASVVNCSWGCTAENRALREAMEGSDMIFVCAVGNNRLDLNETPIYPACYDLDNIISVTSVNDDGGLSYFSNYGNVDIAARGRGVESCFPEGETGMLTGTSISASFVSGALASVYTDEEETIERLYNTSDKLLNLQGYVDGGRRLNLENLISNTENNEVIDINPEEDFNTEGYNRTPEESWELFSALENISVAACQYSLAVLKADGSVWTWGRNNYGQLGNGTYTDSETPQQVPSISGVVELKAGENHMLARTANGNVYTWGVNYYGCLGIGSTTISNVPVQMTNGTNAIGIGAGANVSYVIKSGNVLYACGGNGWGQIGDGTYNTSRTTLTKVNIPENIAYVTGGGGASFAITTDGALYSWGHNAYGRLGNGTTEDTYTPQIIIDSGIVDVNMGFFSALALKSDGTVYKWGYGAEVTPGQVTGLSGITKVVSGRQAEFVLETNTLKSTGMNASGVLGLGDTQWHLDWGTVEGSFSDFSVHEYRAIALGTNGYIYTWGLTDFDTMGYTTAPTKVSGEINNFSGDSFEEAAEVDEGETHGEITSEFRNDYYKFTPISTGLYEIYSISSMDLVCKIYTKNSDGTYTLKYNNDDSSVMSNNSLDFYLMKTFTAGTDYYIYVYPYGSSAVGEYSLYIVPQAQPDSHTTTLSVNSGAQYIFAVTATDIVNIKDAVFTVTYDSSMLTLEDASAQTWNKDTSTGTAIGTNIQITSISASQIKFKVNKTQSTVTGSVNLLKFSAKASGTAEITVEMTQ